MKNDKDVLKESLDILMNYDTKPKSKSFCIIVICDKKVTNIYSGYTLENSDLLLSDLTLVSKGLYPSHGKVFSLLSYDESYKIIADEYGIQYNPVDVRENINFIKSLGFTLNQNKCVIIGS